MTAVAAVLVILNMALVGLTIWRVWTVQHPGMNRSAPAVETIDNPVTSTSVKGGFRMTFPAGWNAVLRPQDRDAFVVAGTAQPGGDDRQRANVKDITHYDCQTACVFEAAIADDFPVPQGDASDFLAGTGGHLLSGRRYINTYDGNDVNASRTNGDKDYIYTFPLGGKQELRVTYRVFADDPVDRHAVVETIAKSLWRQ
jgi:hypothetical protein